MRWLRSFPYEENIYETSIVITTLLGKGVDKSVDSFSTYEMIKEKIIQISAPKLNKKRKVILRTWKESWEKELTKR